MTCQCTGQEQVTPNGKFWCETHQCWKTQHYLDLCRTNERYVRLWQNGVGPGQKRVERPRGLGDMVEAALKAVGITTARYQKLKGALGLKRQCNCCGRKNKLNQLGKKLGIGVPPGDK